MARYEYRVLSWGVSDSANEHNPYPDAAEINSLAEEGFRVVASGGGGAKSKGYGTLSYPNWVIMERLVQE